ncbi:transposase [Flavobacterium covae]|uniref:transposase n=1 Tax=Flavobacterium TaxID=237 RepID=UPI003742383A
MHQTTNDTNTLESHLNSFDENYNRQSKEVVADAGYGSEENYEMLKNKQIEPFVKYNYFHAKQKKKLKENPFFSAKFILQSTIRFLYLSDEAKNRKHRNRQANL